MHAQLLERLAELPALLLGAAEAFGQVGRQDHRDVQRPGLRRSCLQPLLACQDRPIDVFEPVHHVAGAPGDRSIGRDASPPSPWRAADRRGCAQSVPPCGRRGPPARGIRCSRPAPRPSMPGRAVTTAGRAASTYCTMARGRPSRSDDSTHTSARAIQRSTSVRKPSSATRSCTPNAVARSRMASCSGPSPRTASAARGSAATTRANASRKSATRLRGSRAATMTTSFRLATVRARSRTPRPRPGPGRATPAGTVEVHAARHHHVLAGGADAVGQRQFLHAAADADEGVGDRGQQTLGRQIGDPLGPPTFRNGRMWMPCTMPGVPARLAATRPITPALLVCVCRIWGFTRRRSEVEARRRPGVAYAAIARARSAIWCGRTSGCSRPIMAGDVSAPKIRCTSWPSAACPLHESNVFSSAPPWMRRVMTWAMRITASPFTRESADARSRRSGAGSTAAASARNSSTAFLAPAQWP